MAFLGKPFGLTALQKNGAGASLANARPADLFNAFKFAVVTGASANTAIAVTGITPGDKILFVANHPASSTLTDVTSSTTITSANTISISTSTSSNQVMIFWVDLT